MVENRNITVETGETGRVTSSSISHARGFEKVGGADLTEFHNVSDFETLIDMFDLTLEKIDTHDGKSRAYVWVSDNLMVITGANPLSGERWNFGENIMHEKGYASYMRFEGTREAVRAAISHTKNNAFTDGAIGENEDGFI